MQLYKTPFSRAYWSDALRDFKKPRNLVFCALMVAACVVLSYIPSIRLSGGAKVTWGFLARSTCGMVCGPVSALAFGFVEDTVSFLMNPQGVYFPGYALTTMLGTMTYALFLYRTRVTVARIFLAKLCTNVQNVLLGALWNAILLDKAYLLLAGKSALKNLIMLPVQTVLLVVLFAALLPVLEKMGILSSAAGNGLRLRRKEKHSHT